MTFHRFIRFLDEDNAVRYGDLESEMTASDILGQRVQILQGHPISGFLQSREMRNVKTVSKTVPPDLPSPSRCLISTFSSFALSNLSPLSSVWGSIITNMQKKHM